MVDIDFTSEGYMKDFNKEMEEKRFSELSSWEKIKLLLKKVDRGADIEGLIKKMEEFGYNVAPASTQYNYSYVGGLCDYSYRMYETMKKLNEAFGYKYNEDTIIIISLLHDLYKADYYKQYWKNVKNSSGNWEQVSSYQVKEWSERVVIGSPEETSLYTIQQYIPLSKEEVATILNINITSNGEMKRGAMDVLNAYSLVSLANSAKIISTFSNL